MKAADQMIVIEGSGSENSELVEGLIFDGVKFRRSGLSDDPFSAFYILLKRSKNLSCFTFDTSAWEEFKKELIHRIKSINKEYEQTVILDISLPVVLKEKKTSDKDGVFDVEEELKATLGKSFLLYITFNNDSERNYRMRVVTGDLPPLAETYSLTYQLSQSEPIGFGDLAQLFAYSNRVKHFHVETSRVNLDETTIAGLESEIVKELANLPFKSDTSVMIQIHISSFCSIKNLEVLSERLKHYNTCFKELNWGIAYVEAEKTEAEIYVTDLEIEKKCEDIEGRIYKLAPNSIIDGIIDFETYSLLPSDKPRILWVLKEANSPENKRFTFSDLLVKDNEKYNKKLDTPTLKRVIYTSFGILNNFIEYNNMPSIYPNDDDTKPNEPKVYDAARQIAYINIKKIPGGMKANANTIAKAYRENKELILDQLSTYRPNIVIFGNTMKYLFEDLGIEERDKLYVDENTHNTTYYIHNNTLYIHAYHPAYISVTIDVYCNEIISVARKWWQEYLAKN